MKNNSYEDDNISVVLTEYREYEMAQFMVSLGAETAYNPDAYLYSECGGRDFEFLNNLLNSL